MVLKTFIFLLITIGIIVYTTQYTTKCIYETFRNKRYLMYREKNNPSSRLHQKTHKTLNQLNSTLDLLNNKLDIIEDKVDKVDNGLNLDEE